MNVYEALMRDGKERRDQFEAAKAAGDELTHAALVTLLPGTYYMDPPDGGSVTLLEQLQRMAKDAERYRWLRSADNDVSPLLKPNGIGWQMVVGGRLDAAIDAAIAAELSHEFMQAQAEEAPRLDLGA